MSEIMDWPNISDQEKAEAQARLDALRAGREDPQTQKWSESELMRVNGIPCVYTFWFGKYHVHLPGMPDALSLEHLIAYGYRAELPDKPRKATTAEMAERKQFRMRSEECSKKLNLVEAHRQRALILWQTPNQPRARRNEMNLITVRDEEEVNNLLNKCSAAEDSGESRYPGMSYEQGIQDAIRWLTEETEPGPLED